MFEAISKIFSICVKGTLDLVLGVVASTVVSEIFPYKAKSEDMILKQSVEIVMQTCLTLLIGLEARNLFFSEEDAMTSPYGITFMMALFQQPSYWQKINDLKVQIIKDFFAMTNPSK